MKTRHAINHVARLRISLTIISTLAKFLSLSENTLSRTPRGPLVGLREPPQVSWTVEPFYCSTDMLFRRQAVGALNPSTLQLFNYCYGVLALAIGAAATMRGPPICLGP